MSHVNPRGDDREMCMRQRRPRSAHAYGWILCGAVLGFACALDRTPQPATDDGTTGEIHEAAATEPDATSADHPSSSRDDDRDPVPSGPDAGQPSDPIGATSLDAGQIGDPRDDAHLDGGNKPEGPDDDPDAPAADAGAENWPLYEALSSLIASTPQAREAAALRRILGAISRSGGAPDIIIAVEALDDVNCFSRDSPCPGVCFWALSQCEACMTDRECEEALYDNCLLSCR